MAGAYATIARGGTYIAPQLVRRVEARDGFKKEFGVFPQKVFPDSPVRALISCMESAVKEGTGVLARLSDRPVAGKTGTSDEARDLWFVGFTPHMVTAVWGGNDQHRSLGGLTGGTVLTGIWKAYNQQYYRTHKVPKGTFYTEQRSNDNLWDQLLRKPAEETEEPTETEAPETVMPPQPQSQSPEGEEQQQTEGQQTEQPNGEAGEPENHFFPLPGMPEPGRVRHPVRPSQNDPFAPHNYQDEAPQDEQQGPQPAGPFGPFRAPENPFGSPQGPRQPREREEQDHAPMPAPDRDRLPLPAPDRGAQNQPQPAPAPEPAPSPNRYDGILREEAEPIE
jgi:membrane carboxypeptidase/penicillin-binding protein PbpC